MFSWVNIQNIKSGYSESFRLSMNNNETCIHGANSPIELLTSLPNSQGVLSTVC